MAFFFRAILQVTYMVFSVWFNNREVVNLGTIWLNIY